MTTGTAMATASYENVIRHLGGDERLRSLGIRAYDTDAGHICLKLLHKNPRGVSTVTITECGVHYSMDCFARLAPETFSAPLVGHAEGILAENLATVLGQLTGVEEMHHHHY